MGCFSCAFGSYFRVQSSYKNLKTFKNLIFFKNQKTLKNLYFFQPSTDCGVRIYVRITLRAVVFIATVAEIYSLGHGLRTFTAVPSSTQPCTLRGTVK